MHLGYLALRTTIDEWRAKARNPNGTVQQSNGEQAIMQEEGEMAPPPAPAPTGPAPNANGRRREYEDHDAPARDVKRQRYD